MDDTIENLTDHQLMFRALIDIAKRQSMSHMQIDYPAGDLWKEIKRRTQKKQNEELH